MLLLLAYTHVDEQLGLVHRVSPPPLSYIIRVWFTAVSGITSTVMSATLWCAWYARCCRLLQQGLLLVVTRVGYSYQPFRSMRGKISVVVRMHRCVVSGWVPGVVYQSINKTSIAPISSTDRAQRRTNP